MESLFLPSIIGIGMTFACFYALHKKKSPARIYKEFRDTKDPAGELLSKIRSHLEACADHAKDLDTLSTGKRRKIVETLECDFKNLVCRV